MADQLTQWAQATRTAIDLLMGASQLDEVAPAVLGRLAHAARCDGLPPRLCDRGVAQ
jgi:hypothetical protein